MNNLCADIGYKSVNHYGEQLCGDHVDVVEQDENSTVIVLADGLGSGVKANILSTLTSKIISTMISRGASIEDIQEYCRLCLLEESEENLRTRYAIIRKQREEAYRRLEEAKATVKYMEDKAAHYEAILAGLAPDDTNPKNWTAGDRPEHETCSFS